MWFPLSPCLSFQVCFISSSRLGQLAVILTHLVLLLHSIFHSYNGAHHSDQTLPIWFLPHSSSQLLTECTRLTLSSFKMTWVPVSLLSLYSNHQLLTEWILIPDASQNSLQRLKHTHILTEHAQGEDGFEAPPCLPCSPYPHPLRRDSLISIPAQSSLAFQEQTFPATYWPFSHITDISTP